MMKKKILMLLLFGILSILLSSFVSADVCTEKDIFLGTGTQGFGWMDPAGRDFVGQTFLVNKGNYNLTQIEVNVKRASANCTNTGNVGWLLYDVSGGNPNNLIAELNTTVPNDWILHNDYQKRNVTSPTGFSLVNGTSYALVWNGTGIGGDNCGYHFDSGTTYADGKAVYDNSFPASTWIDQAPSQDQYFKLFECIASEPLFEITANSFWDNSSINVFNATINGTTYNTSSGTITTNINQSSAGVFNITVFSTGWFNQTVEHNISSNLDQSLKQTQANISFNFSSGELINFSSINLTSIDTGEFFNVTEGFDVLFPNAGMNNFSVISPTNIFSSFNFTLNLTALDNSSFDFIVNETQNIITFLDDNSSSPIDNATVTIGFPSGFSLIVVTNSTGQINFSYIQNSTLEFGDYTYLFDKIGYVNISLSDVINSSNIPHTRTYNISRAKLNIFIFDRVTRNLLTGVNVTVAFIGLFNETTTTGTIVKNNLTIVAGDYIIFASAEGFKTSIRTLTFTNQEEFTLNFYLLNLSNPNAGTLFVTTKDSFFRNIEGAKVDLLEYIPGSLSFVSVDSCVSNVNAECSFAVELNTKVYFIRATSIIGSTVFVAETSQNGEIFTVNNDVRDLIFFTRSDFTISTSTNLIYDISETFISNVSSIDVDFFTSDGTAKEVCVEYFILTSGLWVTVTGDTYCLFSSNAIQNIDVDVTLNRSNTYQARVYVKESFDNILKTFDYPNIFSAGSIFDNDYKAIFIMIFWVFALAYSLHQKNISLFFFLAIIISWVEVALFPIFTMVAVSVFKTIVSLFSIYIARKKQDFQ